MTGPRDGLERFDDIEYLCNPSNMSIGQLNRRLQVLLHHRAFRDDLKEEMLLHRELRARQFASEGKSSSKLCA